MHMTSPNIVYVSYIRSSPERVWDALTNPDITERYWFDTRIESTWAVGDTILYRRHGTITDEQRVLAVEPLRVLRHTFHPVLDAQMRAEPPSRVTFDLARDGEVVRLTLVHDEFPPNSTVQPACSNGWPKILGNLKTLLETGKPLPAFGFAP
jgi:uncharacterized protein YndB with AHSA1/START domain